MPGELRRQEQSEETPERLSKIDELVDNEKKSTTKIEAISGYSEEILGQVLDIERESFPEEIQSSPENLKEILENSDGIHLLARDKDEKVVGALLSLRQSQEYEFLKDYDPDFANDENSLYVESIAIKPKSRSIEVANGLFKTLVEQAKERHFKKITMHARVSNGLSDVLQKRCGAKFFKRIENWYGFGEPFDYLEIEIPEE